MLDLIQWLQGMLNVCVHLCVRNVYTVWHENLTVIKFYGFSKLLKYKKSTDFKFYGNRSNLVSCSIIVKVDRFFILRFCKQS